KPAWGKVQHVPGGEGGLEVGGEPRTLDDGIAVVGPGFIAERIAVDGFVDRPALLSRDLDDEDVVYVVMRVEPARRRRGDVRVDLDRMPDVGDELAGEGRERLPRPVKSLQHQCRAVAELTE